MRKLFPLILALVSLAVYAQELPVYGPLTLRPSLLQLSTQLL